MEKRSQPSILIVDDEELLCEFMKDSLVSTGFFTQFATNLSEAISFINSGAIDILVTDVKINNENGFKLIEHLHTKNSEAAVIIITGFPDNHTVKIAEQYNVSSYLVKPFTANQIKYSILKAWESCKENGVLHTTNNEQELLLGKSAYICNLRKKIELLSQGTFPVLIEGDSGTGKEVIAKKLHQLSLRTNHPMLSVNCAAIPHHLEDAEFFGYTRGAFTGAHSMKHGIFASADKSTLFLDEIGDLSLDIQAKLLRVLDSGEFIRIGESTSRKVDVRIISATNRNLSMMVTQGKFRGDLYYRLKGAHIQTEPLANHKEDIPLLIGHFLDEFRSGTYPQSIDDDAKAILSSYGWPGNVRELRHAIEYLCATSKNLKAITAEFVKNLLGISLVKPIVDFEPYCNAKENILKNFETTYFTALLAQYNGNINRASKAAGMYRPNLIKKLRQLDIDPNNFRTLKRKEVSLCIG